MAALANLLLLGKEGYRTLLGHAVEMAEVLREHDRVAPEPDGAQRRQRRPGDAVSRLSRRRRHLSREGCASAAMRAIASSCCEHNEYNRRIFERVHAEALAGHGVAISLTNCYRQNDYGEPIVALKTLRAVAVRGRKPDGDRSSSTCWKARRGGRRFVSRARLARSQWLSAR